MQDKFEMSGGLKSSDYHARQGTNPHGAFRDIDDTFWSGFTDG